MNFVVVDVETANSHYWSLCQIGIVRFEDGRVVDQWCQVVDPRTDFGGINMRVHGITEKHVEGAPTFPEISGEIRRRLSDRIMASHMPFDRLALKCATAKHDLNPIECRWVDTARVYRRVWPDRASSGYGLKKIADELGIVFKHHDAAEDARAAGEILICAIKESGLGSEEWVGRSMEPIAPDLNRNRKGSPGGHLSGETVVFTGALSLPRREATEMAVKAGCDVATSVGATTTILVVGDLDLRRLAGEEKSSKIRKAEALHAKGQDIHVIGESDFMRLVEIEAA